jgi:hypothetical protein
MAVKRLYTHDGMKCAENAPSILVILESRRICAPTGYQSFSQAGTLSNLTGLLTCSPCPCCIVGAVATRNPSEFVSLNVHTEYDSMTPLS